MCAPKSMPAAIDNQTIASLRAKLDQHPVYAAVSSLADLRCFMQHHVYSVWDFMSLIKYLQARVAPTRVPWVPVGDAAVRRFINELALEEESDETNVPGEHASHFELYLRAMEEIGADTRPMRRFVSVVQDRGIDAALALDEVPEPARRFTGQTFAFIGSERPHAVAAALALGREHIIPGMFRAILARTGVSDAAAPTFHFYLNRHIHLDEDFHAPLSLRLLDSLCGGDPKRTEQAVAAADAAVRARLRFWDGVLEAIEGRDDRGESAGREGSLSGMAGS
jgi:hypothetical protein